MNGPSEVEQLLNKIRELEIENAKLHLKLRDWQILANDRKNQMEQTGRKFATQMGRNASQSAKIKRLELKIQALEGEIATMRLERMGDEL